MRPHRFKTDSKGTHTRYAALMQASATLHSAGAALGAVVGAQMGSVLDARRFAGDGIEGSRREELRRLRDGCVREVSLTGGRADSS